MAGGTDHTTTTTARMPAFRPRMLAMPLVRLLVLGAGLFVMLVMSNNVMAALSGRPLAAAAGVAGMTAAGLAVYVGFARLVERRRAEELSLPGMGRELGLGLAIGAGLYAACVLVLIVLGIYRIEGLNPWSFLLPALAMALSSGIFEELLFRGVVYRSVEQVCGSWVALAVSSVVFGFTHLLNPAGTVMGAAFISIEAGLLLAAAYMLTRRLWLSMGFHMAWNYTQSAIFSGIVSGGDGDPGLIRATIEGPAVLTGGSFGLESSLVALVLCTATGIVLLVLAVRRGHIAPPSWRRAG